MTRLEKRYNELQKEERSLSLFEICEILNGIRRGSVDGFTSDQIIRFKNFLIMCVATWEYPADIVDQNILDLILNTLKEFNKITVL